MVEKFWFEKSKEFLDLAKKHLEDGYYWFVCFGSQQSVEFALKGILVKHKGVFPFTHDLGELAERVRDELSIDVPQNILHDCDFLTPHYVMSRYSQFADYNRRKAEECLKSATEVVEWLKRNFGLG
ncbi:HEPN domain-containing protein [Stygiolobus caldivivus]|uniref:DNA-binding protein n=1 Tax=Stygiolobus caldivivus TaxID=2824673 RepID=A0A8D5U9F7_9CREN|nr:HEPN domain-containing protein [Stygiolobus caldivivus]BCU71124.1 DNA-binding protein [Stygiolobus caldivivus]